MKDEELPIEQKICVSCGFCCDRTLFDYAKLQEGEERFESMNFEFNRDNDELSFIQPCHHFCEKCTIYDQDKPAICSAFRCSVLKSVEKEEMTADKAMNMIAEVRKERDNLLLKFNELTDLKYTTFREALFYLENEEEFLSTELLSLKYRFVLLNIQLAKYFKTKGSWEKYYDND